MTDINTELIPLAKRVEDFKTAHSWHDLRDCYVLLRHVFCADVAGFVLSWASNDLAQLIPELVRRSLMVTPPYSIHWLNIYRNRFQGTGNAPGKSQIETTKVFFGNAQQAREGRKYMHQTGRRLPNFDTAQPRRLIFPARSDAWDIANAKRLPESVDPISKEERTGGRWRCTYFDKRGRQCNDLTTGRRCETHRGTPVVTKCQICGQLTTSTFWLCPDHCRGQLVAHNRKTAERVRTAWSKIRAQIAEEEAGHIC